jgi:hypothetical protein
MSEPIDKYERAVHRWVQVREKLPPDAIEWISNVEFTTISEGGCSSCEYTTSGVEYRYKEPKKRVRYGEIYISGMTAVQFFRECVELMDE